MALAILVAVLAPAAGPMTKLLGDEALVRRAQTGDRHAFELLVARYTRFAGAVALGVLGDYHGALDVVQEAFVKVLRGLNDLDDPRRFKGWLRNVVRRTALDARRRRRVAGRSGDPLPGEEEGTVPLPAPDVRPEDLLARAELREQVRHEIAQLPETQREVVMLKYIEGMSYEAIAEATGLTVSTIESRLFRARNALRQRLVTRFGAAGEQR